jgi:hypothetical protein
MHWRTQIAPLLFALLCGACSGAPDESTAGSAHALASDAASGTTLARFGADGSFSLEGELTQGGQLDIEYDVSRLPDCRDRRYGQPAWSILARYRFASGQTGYVAVTDGTGTLTLSGSGALELWFENQGYYGCRAYDSRYGENYRFTVAANADAPGWVGNGRYVIDRMTCNGPCDSSRKPLEETFTHGSWARQRAAIRAIYFDVWKAGVTDFDNPELWQELDVQVHYRARREGPFRSEYVSFFKRVGNDARYELDMAAIDPFAGFGRVEDPADCPDADILTSGDGVTIGADVEYYFTVNGVVFRNENSQSNFMGRFEHYRDQYDVCIDAELANHDL